MANYDVFNGDADGICALHQMRLVEPLASRLITGVKRDIALIEQADGLPGDTMLVLDLSLDKNRKPLQKLLETGVKVTYVDHHFAGAIPTHPALQALIDPAPGVCTSLLVDRMLQGKYRIWSVVGAFGDNMQETAERLAKYLDLTHHALNLLQQLGHFLNYNAYGETVDDLYFHPAKLYDRLHAFHDPFDFIEEEEIFTTLKQGYEADMAQVQSQQPEWVYPEGSVYILPDQSWSRRISGEFGNHLARTEHGLAHAILTCKSNGGFAISVRAPSLSPIGADDLCRQFETGGGRKSAGGINCLPESDLERFLTCFQKTFMTASKAEFM